jgi:hypothetical protein
MENGIDGYFFEVIIRSDSLKKYELIINNYNHFHQEDYLSEIKNLENEDENKFSENEKKIIKFLNGNNIVVISLILLLDDFIQTNNISSSKLNKTINFN